VSVTRYEGDQPFVFTVYAKEDDSIVRPLLEALSEKGLRFWYDSEQKRTLDHSEAVASKLRRADAMIVFMSTSCAVSPLCRRELQFAIELEKEYAVVYLDGVTVSDGLRMEFTLQPTLKLSENTVGELLALDMMQKSFESAAVLRVPSSPSKPEIGETIPQAVKEDPPVKEVPPAKPDPDEGARLNSKGTACYREKRYEEAARLFEGAAKMGSAHGAYNLGLCYMNGNGVSQNTEEALRWYQVAAEAGHAVAQFKLGHAHYTGKGAVIDGTRAVAWFRKAAQNGSGDGAFYLGECYLAGFGVKAKPSEAVTWYKLAAEQNHVVAKYRLGVAYESGEGVSPDAAEAYRWYLMAGEAGYAHAQYKLGTLYKYGRGVESKSHEKAFFWYKKAADNGSTDAMFAIANCYFEGKGVKQDAHAALQWYVKAASLGHKAAIRLCKKHNFKYT